MWFERLFSGTLGVSWSAPLMVGCCCLTVSDCLVWVTGVKLYFLCILDSDENSVPDLLIVKWAIATMLS